MSSDSFLSPGGFTVHVSKAAIVGGGLSPPPSRIYPGTKCFMVTATVDSTEYHGFGPTSSIARRAAMVKAYKSLRPPLLAGELELDNMNVQEATCSDSEDCFGDTLDQHMHLSQAEKNRSSIPVSPSTGIQVDSPSSYCVDSSPDNNVINVLFKVARRKGIEVNFQFVTTYPPTDVVAMASGGGLMFEGRDKMRFVAQCEAAEKMLKALEEGWPDHSPISKSTGNFHKQENTLPTDYPRICTVPYPYGPTSTTSRPPHPRPTSYSDLRYPSHSNDPHLQVCPSRPCYTKGKTHPIEPLRKEDLTSSGEECNKQKRSFGLCEVIPSQHDSHAVTSGSHTTVNYCDADVSGPGNRKVETAAFVKLKECYPAAKKNVATVAPFDNNLTPYSDPFQFTVRLPRRKHPECESSGKPPWNDIRHDQFKDTSLHTVGVNNRKVSAPKSKMGEVNSVVGMGTKHPFGSVEIKRPLCNKNVSQLSRSSLVQDSPVSSGIDIASSSQRSNCVSLPNHELLGSKVGTSIVGSKILPTHFVLTTFNDLQQKSSTTNKSSWQSSMDFQGISSSSSSATSLQKKMHVNSSLTKDVVDSVLNSRDICVGMPTEGPLPR